ncbi:MAG: hypothetical protein ACLGIS_11380, partial [Actinomycetes bacterium]
MSTIAETVPAEFAGASVTGAGRAFAVNRALVLDEISDVFQSVDPAEVAALVTELRLADRIFVTGAGRSGLVLKMAAMRLMHLGLTVHVVGEVYNPGASLWKDDLEVRDLLGRVGGLTPDGHKRAV